MLLTKLPRRIWRSCDMARKTQLVIKRQEEDIVVDRGI